MSPHELAATLDAVATLEGMQGCAVADTETGMVWHSAGSVDPVPLAEAATDYWRLCQRQRPAFAALGELRAQVVIHAHARLTLVACGPGLLLVCVSDEPDRVDWPRWKRAVARLQGLAVRL